MSFWGEAFSYMMLQRQRILQNSWEEIRQELNVELDDNKGRVEVHVRPIWLWVVPSSGRINPTQSEGRVFKTDVFIFVHKGRKTEPLWLALLSQSRRYQPGYCIRSQNARTFMLPSISVGKKKIENGIVTVRLQGTNLYISIYFE